MSNASREKCYQNYIRNLGILVIRYILSGRLLPLLTNMRLSWTGPPAANTLAFYKYSEITVEKSFITRGQASQKPTRVEPLMVLHIARI